MVRGLRHVGIAIGSLSIAWLAVGLVAGVVFGRASMGNGFVELVVIVLGGLIFRDILRREQAST
jgi:hypothetical protein